MSKINGSKNIWKSIKEYQDDPEVLSAKLNEFKEGVTDDFAPEEMNKFSRRKFLAVLAASTAYAATACTSYRDKGEIVPYVDRPEEILPGKPTFYASSFSDDGISYGILVKTREGRPIKIDGNPDDAINNGKVPSKVHASILNLYDPERIQYPKISNLKSSWKKVDDEIVEKLAAAKATGKEIAVILNPSTSVTTKKVLQDFADFYSTTKIYTTQLSNSNNRRDAWLKSYNQKLVPSIKWNEASVILALESDFLGKEGNTIENRALFAKGRDIVNDNSLSKLYSVEAGMSLTGMNSDVRLRLKPSLQLNLILGIINELLKNGVINSNSLQSNVLSIVNKFTLKNIAEKSGLDINKLQNLVSDLTEKKGQSIVYAGDTLPTEVHMAANLLNELLGNSNLYSFESAFVFHDDLSNYDEIESLTNNMKAGNVGAVIHFDSNPVYELPTDLEYASSLSNVDTVITLATAPNESTKVSKYVLPLNDTLESWGEHNSRNGQLTLQQPVISPLFDTKQKESVILNWITGDSNIPQDFQFYLKNSVKSNFYDRGDFAADFESFWVNALHDGVVKIKSDDVSISKLNQSEIKVIENQEEGFEIVLQNNYAFGNGRYSNNGWLQELPHPVSKVTWDNYAAIAPASAEKLNLENNDLVKISIEDRELEIAIMLQPGMAEDTLVIELGYGRTNSGEVSNEVGFNANLLLDSKHKSKYTFSGATVEKIEGSYELVSTQEHHSLNDDFVKDFHRIRNIIKDGTLEEYQENPKFLQEHKHEIFSITDSHEYKNEKWAMSIDLNKCLGCSECISSCNVENNVPVVGKDQVALGREMQWMRIDRYYSGTPEEPIVSTQPMLCQHCDNAPCENVCPVNATNHSPDGLNQMAYNRCVGTRYCANNCPYKVRRFNFYNFRDSFADALYDNELSYLANNPEVTVRSRGVIEKCTFCIQNIMEARETAIKEGRELKANEVTTSCQTACPSNAIEFGDSNNPDSRVTKHREHDLNYHVLEELNVRPNVTYLAKIRNTRTEDV